MSTIWATAGFENVVPGCGLPFIPDSQYSCTCSIQTKKTPVRNPDTCWRSIAPCLANSGLRYKGRDAFSTKSGFLCSNTDILLHPEEGPHYMK